jgi:hypothetical protein
MPFSREQLDTMLELAQSGIRRLIEARSWPSKSEKIIIASHNPGKPGDRPHP